MQTRWYKWLRKGTRLHVPNGAIIIVIGFMLLISFLAECLHQFPVLMFLQFELTSVWPSHMFLQIKSNC